MKYHPQSASILDQKKSHYNAGVIKGMCEKYGIDSKQITKLKLKI
jgi:phage shock protein PspC (stress-responsive transcriptional regulator)